MFMERMDPKIILLNALLTDSPSPINMIFFILLGSAQFRIATIWKDPSTPQMKIWHNHLWGHCILEKLTDDMTH